LSAADLDCGGYISHNVPEENDSTVQQSDYQLHELMDSPKTTAENFTAKVMIKVAALKR
jgi:hypothetical protein